MGYDPSFADQRHFMCIHCGGGTETREHVASKVLLDEPYPPELPVAPACGRCNSSFSLDEEYLACLVDCVIAGSTDPDRMTRPKVSRILRKRPALAARINDARRSTASGHEFSVEVDRVRNVIEKLARGHAQFALSEPQLAEPSSVSFLPLEVLGPHERRAFESVPPMQCFPEVGSRAFQDMVVCEGDVSSGEVHNWMVLQPGRYRFLVTFDTVVSVRIVLSEYLACEVLWS